MCMDGPALSEMNAVLGLGGMNIEEKGAGYFMVGILNLIDTGSDMDGGTDF